MDGAIYNAEMYCDDCAEKIKRRIEADGSDSPQHCAAGGGCVNAHEFEGGCKIGVWLENDLTLDGEDYVKDAVREGGDVAELWAYYYDYLDFDEGGE